MATQNWIYGLSIYFVGIFIIVSLFSMGSLLSNDVTQTTGNFKTDSQSYNRSQVADNQGFSMGTYFGEVFSFFIWDIGYYNTDQSILMQYFWIIRLIIVWIPGLFLALAIYYSLPTVSG
jgi:hypothetical protein